MGDWCPICGNRLLHIREGLSKCLFCGQYIDQKKQLPPKLNIISSLTKIQAVEAGITETTTALSADMVIFIRRISETLAPTEGLDGEARARALNVQEQFQRQLTDVFQGKGDFSKWFDKTKTSLGLHPFNFMTILHEALEGLKSSEAQELREQYAQTIRRMRT